MQDSERQRQLGLDPSTMGGLRRHAMKKGYELTELIDGGASGWVFKAKQLKGNQTVALKVLRQPYEDRWLERFARESNVLSKLSHQRVVKVLGDGVFELGDFKAFAMEFVEGISLKTYLEEQFLTEHEALHFILKLAPGIQHVHSKGIVHRDLHRGNVMLRGGTLTDPVIVDFGTARDVTLNQIGDYQTFWPIGAMTHCAPEKWMDPHNATATSDIFSLGVLIYHAITGAFPYWEDTYIKLYEKIKSGKHKQIRTLRPNISVAFNNLVESTINPDGLVRISDASVLLTACNKLVRQHNSHI